MALETAEQTPTVTIDLLKEYNARIIEGIDEAELFNAIRGNKDTAFVYDNNIARHKKTGIKVSAGCIGKYYKPKKSYYRIDERSSCKYIQNAILGSVMPSESCSMCFDMCMRTSVDTNSTNK